jgi:enoyl-CoA hydratase/carnithine racemase
MELTAVRHDVADGILTVTLNRPERLNAFTVAMADELEWTFATANAWDDIRAIVVTGAGRAFCAGMDLAEDGNPFGLDETLMPTLTDMIDLDDPALRRVRDTGGRVTLAIHACRKPVIAAINGPAVGVGATMTVAMDARLMTDHASIGFVFGKLGITPDAASSWFLPKIIGIDHALDLMYSAEILGANRALEIGLVRSIYKPDMLLAAARELAMRWSHGRSAIATALARQMLYRNSALASPADAHRIDSLAMFYTSTGDGREGVRAFREKRRPEFTLRASNQMPPFYDKWLAPGEPD